MPAAEYLEPEVELDVVAAPVRCGRMLGRYLLCYELGSGGMATVYLARADGAAGFRKLVALKLIHPHLAKQSEFEGMFLDEARVAARIAHPNVCSVFDFGHEDGTYFLTMDHLVGETAARVARTAWQNEEIATRASTSAVFARIVADACEGLHAAHETRGADGALLGVVHRDVTPHNIFVGYDGSVRVIDFGVAKSNERAHHTVAGILKGKFPYMSPEQVRRDGVDRRSDVWALGVCLWELLTGRRLFARTGELETLEAVTSAPIPRVSAVAPHAPVVFDAIVARALDRDRGARYATARELGRDLAAAIGTLGSGSAADVAELMGELFEAERVERLALLEHARALVLEPNHGPLSTPIRALDGLATFRRQGAAAVTSTSRPPRRGAPWSVQPPPEADLELALVGTPGSRAAPRAGRSPRALAAGGLLLVLGAVVISVVAFTGAGPADPDASRPSELALRTEGPEPPARPPLPVGAPPPASPAASTEVSALAEVSMLETAPLLSSSSAPEPPDRGRYRALRARAAVEGMGTLRVVSPDGSAEVFVGRLRVGRSPMTLTLPAGSCTVRLEPDGGGVPLERTVALEAGRTTELVVRFGAPAS